MVCNQPRICRAIFSYPTDLYTGAGLPSYYLSQYVPFSTLLLTRCLQGKRRSIDPQVKLKCFRFPNPGLSGAKGRMRILWRGIGKFLGIFLFTIQAVPFVVWFRPHILHIHTHLPLPLALVGKIVGAKVLVNFHGTDLLAVQQSRLLRLVCKVSAAEIWHVSEAMREPLRTMFPGKGMFRLPSGVDLSLFRDTGSERKQQVVSVGTLKWQKGFHVLLQAIGRITDQLPDLSLIIVGDGEEWNNLVKLARDLRIEKKVTFLGRLSQEEIAKILNESALYVSSSISEGFPKVLLEALACGLPLVVTDVGDCGELVSENKVGTVVEPNDSSALGEAIMETLLNKRLYKRFARNARSAVERYDWKSVAHIAQQEYERLL